MFKSVPYLLKTRNANFRNRIGTDCEDFLQRERKKKKVSLSTFLVADHAIFFTVQQKAKRTYVHAGACLQPRLTTRSPFTRVYVGHQS